MLLPSDRPAGTSVFLVEDVATECIVKGAGEADIIPTPAALKGNLQWHLVERPCQLFVCILNSSGRYVV